MFRMGRLRMALTVVMVLSGTASADVVRIEITEQTPVLDGKSFGATGPYVRIVGKVHFAVDPTLPVNQVITDLALAPRNRDGRVEFSSDLYLLRPLDAAKGNGTAFLEISNRGRKGMLSTFNMARGSGDPRTAQEFGDGLLMERGFTVAWLGWQTDVDEVLEAVYTDVKPGTPRDPHLLRFNTPVASTPGGPIKGWVRSDFVPDRKSFSFHLADRTHRPYLVVDPDDPGVRLTVRDRRDAPRQTIPRELWQFAREENGKPVPSRAHVYMAQGFEAGRIYEMVYKSQDPVVVGLGLAAVRDFISFLKYGSPGVRRPDPGGDWTRLQRAISFGPSQSGRFLRTYLYLGFNQDERNRQVFDGVWSHVGGGGRGSFNHRFAQPSRDARPFFNFFYPTDIFPFTDAEQTDPQTGQADGLLTRARKSNTVPRIFNTNSSYQVRRPRGLAHSHHVGWDPRRRTGSENAHLPDCRRVAWAGPISSRTERHAERVECERLQVDDARTAGCDAGMGRERRRTAGVAVSEDIRRPARAARLGAVSEDSRRRVSDAHALGLPRGLRPGVPVERNHFSGASESRTAVRDARSASGPHRWQ